MTRGKNKESKKGKKINNQKITTTPFYHDKMELFNDTNYKIEGK